MNMVFILRKDRPENSTNEFRESWNAYQNYLESVKNNLPQSVYEFAIAEWHYDFSNHKALHDSWLEEIIVREIASGDRKQFCSTEIFVRLLGAYHDGFIELTYKNVQSYSFEKRGFSPINTNDWLYDEIRISQNNFALHEIEWDSADWLIECADILYEWKHFKDKSDDEIAPK